MDGELDSEERESILSVLVGAAEAEAAVSGLAVRIPHLQSELRALSGVMDKCDGELHCGSYPLAADRQTGSHICSHFSLFVCFGWWIVRWMRCFGRGRIVGPSQMAVAGRSFQGL